MALAFVDQIVVTRTGRKMVLVSRPEIGVVVGEDALQRLRRSADPSALDVDIVSRAERGSYDVYLFRARDGKGSWGVDPGMDPTRAKALGRLLVESQLWIYRRLAAAGVGIIVASELDDVTLDALSDGTRAAVEARAGSTRPRDRLDTWLLKHMTFFTALSTQRVLGHLLPDQLPLIERSRPSLVKLLDEVAGEAASR